MENEYFTKINNVKTNKTLTIINNFKTIQQQTTYTCGPACVLMMLKHYGINYYSENNLAKILKTNSHTGTDLDEIVSFFKDLKIFNVISSITYQKNENGLCFSNKTEFKKFVLSHLKNNNPILVENVDYGGHYKIIIGYDCLGDEKDMLIFADPSDNYDGKIDGLDYFPAERFFYMWFDDHCLSKKYKKQPFCVLEKK